MLEERSGSTFKLVCRFDWAQSDIRKRCIGGPVGRFHQHSPARGVHWMQVASLSLSVSVCLSLSLSVSLYLSLSLSVSLALALCLSVLCCTLDAAATRPAPSAAGSPRRLSTSTICTAGSVCLPACLPACLPVCLSVCLSVSLTRDATYAGDARNHVGRYQRSRRRGRDR